MAKYRIKVSFDKKNPFWVVIENGKMIRNPTKDQLYGTKLRSYNKTNTCPICREEYEKDGKKLTDISILFPGNVRHVTDKNGEKTDIYVCSRHGVRDYERYDSNSRSNAHKALAGRRTGDLRDHCHIFGDNCEILMERLLGIKRLSVIYNKYSMLPLDHTPISDGTYIMIGEILVNLSGKIIQTKGGHYNLMSGCWKFKFKGELNSIKKGIKFDYIVICCASKNGQIIERIYIVPIKEIYDLEMEKEIRGGMSIVKTPSRGIQWYDQYRIIDGEILKKVNDIWMQIIKKR